MVCSQLTALLKEKAKRSKETIKWSTTVETFKNKKQTILDISSRSQPDFIREFILTTDASNDGKGRILSQKDKLGRTRIIYCFSRTLAPAENIFKSLTKICSR